MSQEAVKAFFEKVETDEDTGTRYRSFLKEIADGGPDEDQGLSQVVQFAAGNGYEFTSEDLKLAAENMSNEDLSDEQLDTVAAGSGVGWALNGSIGQDFGSWCIVIGYHASGLGS